MAKPREARGWFVYALAIVVGLVMLALRLYYATSGAASPFLFLPWVDAAFMVGILAGALAAIGLHQALWYSLVEPHGRALYGTSLLMFVVATLLLYGLPAHLAAQPFFYLMFTASLVLYLYTPTLSYRSRVANGVGVAGAAVLFASSLYGPAAGLAPWTNPVILTTIVAEGLLLAGLVGLLGFTVRTPRATAA